MITGVFFASIKKETNISLRNKIEISCRLDKLLERKIIFWIEFREFFQKEQYVLLNTYISTWGGGGKELYERVKEHLTRSISIDIRPWSVD